jgi:hypothetical protein
MPFEEQLAGWIGRNIAIFIPCFNLALRLFLNFLIRDTPGTFRRLFALPEDLIFISLSFVFAGMGGLIPSFTLHYSSHHSSPEVAGSILTAIGVGAAILVHVLDSKVVQPIFQRIYVANRHVNANDIPEGERRGIVGLYIGLFSIGFFVFSVDLWIGIKCLVYVLRLIRA